MSGWHGQDDRPPGPGSFYPTLQGAHFLIEAANMEEAKRLENFQFLTFRFFFPLMRSSETPSAKSGETGIPKTKVLIQTMAETNTRHLSLCCGRQLGKRGWVFFSTLPPGRPWGTGERGTQIDQSGSDSGITNAEVKQQQIRRI